MVWGVGGALSFAVVLGGRARTLAESLLGQKPKPQGFNASSQRSSFLHTIAFLLPMPEV